MQETLLLARSEVARLLTLEECIVAVEEAFALHAQGQTLASQVLGVHADDGGFHIKTAGLRTGRTWFAAKCNGNFPRNPERHGLPTIQGLILLCDGENGAPLAVIDSIEITILRTAAATALATRYLARDDASVVTLIGCGAQGRAQVRALSRVRRIERVFAFDVAAERAARLAEEMRRELGIPVESVGDPRAAALASDICVTCTPSRKPLLGAGDVRPGTFVAGVGADNEDKQELGPDLFGRAKVVVDDLEQCARIGDLHHALQQGVVTRESVHAELVDLVAGRRCGRASSEEITLFDSTGVALEDVAAAVALYSKALESGAGTRLAFGS